MRLVDIQLFALLPRQMTSIERPLAVDYRVAIHELLLVNHSNSYQINKRKCSYDGYSTLRHKDTLLALLKYEISS